MEQLHRRGEPIDLVTLTEELAPEGDLESVGSVASSIAIADSVPRRLRGQLRPIVEKATLRDLIGAGGRIMQTAYDQAQPSRKVLDAGRRPSSTWPPEAAESGFEGMTPSSRTFADIERFAN